MIAQQMRQPLSGHRRVPVTRRPGELLPGVGAGAAAGLVLANLINGAKATQPELEQYA